MLVEKERPLELTEAAHDLTMRRTARGVEIEAILKTLCSDNDADCQQEQLQPNLGSTPPRLHTARELRL